MVDLVNGIRYQEPEPYGAAAGRAMQLRQLYQQGKAQEAEQKVNALKLGEAERQIGGRRKLSELLSGSTKDGVTDHNAVFQGLTEAGFGDQAIAYRNDTIKAATEQRKAQLAQAKEQHAFISNGLAAVKLAAPEQKQAVYTALRQRLGAQGLIRPEDMPEAYDPNFVEAELAQGVEAEKQIAAAQKALEIAETGRHNRAGEKTAEATLTETGRHNRAGEAFNVAQLGETGRHNRSTEGLTETQIAEQRRHNRTSEGLTASTLGETRRHNQQSESTAAIAAGQNAGGSPKFKDGLVSLRNLQQALDGYKAELASGSARFPGTEGYTKLQSRFTDLQMRMKDLYSLGAITGPDLQLMNAALTDPTSLKGYATSNDALKAQLDVFNDVLAKGEDTLRSVYNVPKQYNADTKGITVDTSRVPNAGGAPRMVLLQAPNGQVSDVPADQAQHYISLGAKQVN